MKLSCKLNDESLLTVLLFSSKIYNKQVNVQILNASINYIIDSGRFTEVFYHWWNFREGNRKFASVEQSFSLSLKKVETICIFIIPL